MDIPTFYWLLQLAGPDSCSILVLHQSQEHQICSALLGNFISFCVQFLLFVPVTSVTSEWCILIRISNFLFQIIHIYSMSNYLKLSGWTSLPQNFRKMDLSQKPTLSPTGYKFWLHKNFPCAQMCLKWK